MDPLGATTGILEADAVIKWSQTTPPAYPGSVIERESPVPVSEEINSRVALWEGDITKLNVDVIVNSTNEALNDKNPVSERIYRVGGPLLRDECRAEIGACRTGEAKITKGYNLPARYVIHTVGPRYNTKYKTAAESALYMCYRNVLQLAREYKLKTVGVSVINTTRRGYPPEEGAHIGLRTVRRFLEKNLTVFDLIVLVVEPIDESIYKRLTPVYFPRNKDEEQYSFDVLPTDLGNEDGEPFIPERQIRIMDKPIHQEDFEILEEDGGIDLLNSLVGRHPFAAVAHDHDKGRRQGMQGRGAEYEVIDQQRRYSRWLKRSRAEDFSDMVKLNFLYTPGVDYMGRPVVVFIARHFPANQIDLNKAVSYFVHVMDPIASREYVMVYVNSLATQDNTLELGFLRNLYEMLDFKYRHNLSALFVLHGTLWGKIVSWFFTMFSAATIKDKIHFVPGLQGLYDTINPSQLELPPFVMEFDVQENGPSFTTATTPYRGAVL